MKAVSDSPSSVSGDSLKGIPYEDTQPDKPPIPITVAKPPPNAQLKGIAGFHRARAVQKLSPNNSPSKFKDDVRRDSGLAPSSSTARDSRTTLGTEPDSSSSIHQSPSLRIVSSDDGLRDRSTASSPPSRSGPYPSHPLEPSKRIQQHVSASTSNLPFLGILTEIPTGSFEDLTMPGQVSFSKRGSMLIGGRKANQSTSDLVGNGHAVSGRREKNNGSLLKPPPNLPSRILSTDDEAMSRKVRLMYQNHMDQVANGRTTTTTSGTIQGKGHKLANEAPKFHLPSRQVDSEPTSMPIESYTPKVGGYANDRIRDLLKEPNELAGGIEDWEDLHGGDVDRYGFIVPRKFSSQASSINSPRPSTPDPPRLQRVSTLLQLASDTPRQNHSRFRPGRSSRSPVRSIETTSTRHPGTATIRPKSSQSSYRSVNGYSRMRFATNHLPHNKDRRAVDEAGDMLTLPPGLADIAEDQEDSRISYELKQREWNREEKWRKMGKLVKRDKHGGGMVFDFDTKNQKVIERTWKGIPDKWRATAWHSFLTTSAKKRQLLVPDEELIQAFRALLDEGSPDDMQIDIDVPRTVNSHVMFRRRYRGGQRLLFRVLHCMSIYFPSTGYVQGMAALAATLLCYFDEEMAFVMMVRLWQLRGLDRLYRTGFEGLMQALEEFEKNWLRNGEVASKLVRFICIQLLLQNRSNLRIRPS